MIRRIFLKSLLIIVLLSPWGVSPTNAYFSDVAVSSHNTFSAGDWTAPESEIDPLEEYQDSPSFTLSYTVSDDASGIDRVLLYYRYQDGDWVLGASDESVAGSFEFTANEGEGEYEFFSVAVDFKGNMENDTDGNGVLDEDELPLFGDTSTLVDISPPTTMLAVDSYLAVSSELLYNGGFEEGSLNGWEAEGEGDHRVVDEESKAGDYSLLLGFRDTPEGTTGEDLIKQIFFLPENAVPTLSFWYRLLTDDLVSGGFFEAIFREDSREEKIAHYGWDDPLVGEVDLDWRNVSYQFNDLEGTSVEVQFKVSQPHEGYRTWVYVDEVKVTAGKNKIETATPVEFSAHDGAGADNSTIEYQIDEGEVQEYSEPITLSPGIHTITYSATDEAGNEEKPRKIALDVSPDPVDFGVVLNEILANPLGSNDNDPMPGGEWIRLFNNSSSDVDVGGWRLKDASGGVLTISSSNSDNDGDTSDEGETVVPAGGTITVYRNGDSDFTINDQKETIELYNGEALVDSYSWDFSEGLREGKTLKREPQGTGGWKDPEASSSAQLKGVSQGSKIIENIPMTSEDEDKKEASPGASLKKEEK